MTAWPSPGSIVSVPAYIFFRHKGIVSDRWYCGKPMVISCSARIGHGDEEAWDVFSSGQPWQDEGYPSSRSPWEVLADARAMQGKVYNVLSWNCDMFVRACHGLPVTSPQLTIALVAVAAGVAFAVSR